MVERVNPFEGGILDCLEVGSRSAPVDYLGFVEAVDRLRKSVVLAVTDAADRWLDAGFGKALSVFDGHVLAAAVGMMDEPAMPVPLLGIVRDHLCSVIATESLDVDWSGVALAIRKSTKL